MVNDRLQPRSDWSSAGRLAILSGVLFLSGIGSLIFETLWLRLSGLTFGYAILVRRLDSFQFHGGHGAREWFRGLIARSTVAPATALRFSRTADSVPGLHHRFRSPLARGMAAPLFQTLWNYQSILLGLRFVLSFLVSFAAGNSNGINPAGC